MSGVDLVRSAEAAGLYCESHQGSIAKTDVELVCRACGKVLMQLPVGSMLFTQTHGSCTCSWACCETARPSNKPHARHLENREKR